MRNILNHHLILLILLLDFNFIHAEIEEEIPNINDSTTVASQKDSNATVIDSNNYALPQPLKISSGTIKIICNKEDTRVVINNMELGKTPFCRSGFQPGFYNIELYNKECHPFSKMIQIEKYDTVQINASLELSNSQLEPPRTFITQQEVSENSSSVISERRNATVKTSAQVEGNIIINCTVKDATIAVNKVALGKAPVTRSGLPGYYEIDIQCTGYKPYYKMVQLKGNDTILVNADLISERSRLIITSTPSNASVLLNNRVVGMTPFDSSQIIPSVYNLRIELPGYVTIKKTLTLTASTTDTVSAMLSTIAFSDSVKKARSHTFKMFRRVFFGICTAGSVSGVIAYNQKIKKCIDTENKALGMYMEPGLSGYEYDKRFRNYQQAVSQTDKYMRSRRVFTVLSLISSAGLTISIPF